MTTTSKQDEIEKIAKTVYEVNRIYCESLGDFSQAPWDLAPKEIIHSIRFGILSLATNPSITPEMSHENWLTYKRDAGWVYGLEKDIERKQHPCMVPYFDLPDEQKVKDLLFTTIVRSLLRKYGLIK